MPIVATQNNGTIMQVEAFNHGPGIRCALGASACGSIDFDFVPPRDNGGAMVYFIGEAPGEAEALAHKPFVGASGRLIGSALKGYREGQWTYRVGNTVSCRPLTADKRNRTPTEAEVRTCSWYVQADILAHTPRCIICLGKTALSGLFPGLNTTMAELVQMDLHWCGYPVFAEYHPSWVLRKGGKPSRVFEDWQFRLRAVVNYAIGSRACDDVSTNG